MVVRQLHDLLCDLSWGVDCYDTSEEKRKKKKKAKFPLDATWTLFNAAITWC